MIRTWDDERDLVLKQCVAAGHSFANTAAKINRQFGTDLSRNACIGRAKRLGLSVSRSVKVDGAEHRLNRKPEGKTKTITIRPRPQFVCDPSTGFRTADVTPLNISIYELNGGTCHWPFGDNAPYLFCGHPTFGGSSYCECHLFISQGDGTRGEQMALRGVAA